MNGLIAILVVLCCVLTAAFICLAIVHHASKDNSRAAQRRHEAEYAPVRDVYVVLQTTYNVENHTHQDNRQIHIYGQDATLGTGRTEIEQGQYRSLPRQRQALNAPR
jgi:hypothetical protein